MHAQCFVLPRSPLQHSCDLLGKAKAGKNVRSGPRGPQSVRTADHSVRSGAECVRSTQVYAQGPGFPEQFRPGPHGNGELAIHTCVP